MTETELSVIAALAQIGLINIPVKRVEHAGGHRHADRVVDKREKEILPDVAHRRPAEPAGPHDAAQIAVRAA